MITNKIIIGNSTNILRMVNNKYNFYQIIHLIYFLSIIEFYMNNVNQHNNNPIKIELKISNKIYLSNYYRIRLATFDVRHNLI
jgi:hypothetical protein